MATNANKTTRKKVTKTTSNKTNKVELTVKQAMSIRDFLAKNGKTYKFLEAKLANL
jgi:predicted RecB family nuclease